MNITQEQPEEKKPKKGKVKEGYYDVDKDYGWLNQIKVLHHAINGIAPIVVPKRKGK